TPTDGVNYATPSAQVQINVKPATLTITAEDATKVYGQALTLAGTAFTTSGLINGDTVSAVTLASAGAAATAGVAGSPYPITASDATGTGLGNYTISYVAGQLTINPALLTVTANDAHKTYGQALTLNGMGFTTTGLVNGDTVAAVTLTSAGAGASASVSKPGAPYPITPSQATGTGLGNYTIHYAAGKLTVTPVALTVTADNHVLTQGGTMPALTVHYSGFVAGDTPASLTTPPTVTTT